jgi:hypothetical protein
MPKLVEGYTELSCSKPRVVFHQFVNTPTKERGAGLVGKLVPRLDVVAGYLEAAKYWSVVSHVTPPYGTRSFNDYVEKLKAHNYDAGTFRERMRQGSSLTPHI